MHRAELPPEIDAQLATCLGLYMQEDGEGSIKDINLLYKQFHHEIKTESLHNDQRDKFCIEREKII